MQAIRAEVYLHRNSGALFRLAVFVGAHPKLLLRDYDHLACCMGRFDKLIGQQRAPSRGQEDTGLKAIAESVSRCDLCLRPAGLLLAREGSGPRHGAIGGRLGLDDAAISRPIRRADSTNDQHVPTSGQAQTQEERLKTAPGVLVFVVINGQLRNAMGRGHGTDCA